MADSPNKTIILETTTILLDKPFVSRKTFRHFNGNLVQVKNDNLTGGNWQPAKEGWDVRWYYRGLFTLSGKQEMPEIQSRASLDGFFPLITGATIHTPFPLLENDGQTITRLQIRDKVHREIAGCPVMAFVIDETILLSDNTLLANHNTLYLPDLGILIDDPLQFKSSKGEPMQRSYTRFEAAPY